MRNARFSMLVLAGTTMLSLGAAPAGAGVTPDVGTAELISSRPNGVAPKASQSTFSAVNASGRYVAFVSQANRLVPGTDCRRGRFDTAHLYLRDRQSDTTSQVDVRPDGQCANRTVGQYVAPSISANGGLVAFASYATDLAPGGRRRFSDVFVRNVVSGNTTLVSRPSGYGRADADSYDPAISADGTTIVFVSHATNLVPGGVPGPYARVYRHDLATGTTTLVSQTPDGGAPDNHSISPSASGDGRMIVFQTLATDVVPGGAVEDFDVVLYDVDEDTTTLVSRPTWIEEPPDEESNNAAISVDGGTVVYDSAATNLVPGETNFFVNVYRYDVAGDQTTLISRSLVGDPANGDSLYPGVNADGTKIVFSGGASDLVSDDENGVYDVFLHETVTGMTQLVSRTPEGDPANDNSQFPAISKNGSVLTYMSSADDLVPGITLPEGPPQVYAYRDS